MAVNSRDRHHAHHKPHASQEVDESATAKPTIQGEGDEARSGLDRASHQPSSGDHDATASSKENAKSTQLPAEEKIAELQATVADLEDRLKRALADQENSRKRTERDADTAVKFAASGLANDLLPTLDNLQFALNAVPRDEETNESIRRLLEGVKATERGLLSTLKKHGIKRIDPHREPYDPNRHEVVAEVERRDLPPGTVADVLQPGYLHHDRLLRPAMVNVSKNSSNGR